MPRHEHVLEGCAPVPLAGYLKALGVFRLVAEQKDEHARGFWRDERFVLRTRLSEDELIRFFVEEYVPTPIVAPWNGGSGFWPKDNRDGFDAIRNSNIPRFASYRTAIETCQRLIREENLLEAPKDNSKAGLISSLRGILSEDACRWLDGAIVLTAEGPRFPPLLGTGGNDGRLDFSNNFMRRLSGLISSPEERPKQLLQSSVFAEPTGNLDKGAVGQFAPGAAGGLNAGTGYEADSRVNSWDFILTVEGALIFAAAAVRRHARDRKAVLAFPFTTRITGAGSGSASVVDESDARAELWTPLWERPAGFEEVEALMSEGRAVLDREGARDGLGFARAAAQLGTARGIASFQRYGFLMRAGKAYFATPLGRIRVKEKANERAALISELARNGWLDRVRRALRDKNAPASLSTLGRGLDEALFRLAVEDTPQAVQEGLIALGAVMLEVARRPKLRNADKGPPPIPPPRILSSKWIWQGEDGSAEWALAEALASLAVSRGAMTAGSETEDAPLEANSAGDGGFESGNEQPREENEPANAFPFRCHLGPLATGRCRQDLWSDNSGAETLVVWTGRGLLRDMAAVLERRLVENHRRAKGKRFLPLGGFRSAPLWAVAEFLAGRTDGGRIAALAAGLAWVRPRGDYHDQRRPGQMPFAYAALKPLFAPAGVGPEREQKRPVDPLPLARLIGAGRVADAVTQAQRLARGRGLPAPYAMVDLMAPIDPSRLAATLLFPIHEYAHAALIERAYPNLSKPREDSDAA